jgi:outer membrane murein-binding lipoprotein Lpp
MDDSEQVEQLENRIDKLESTIETMMPSRRDALKMGGAALVGGSLVAGSASALPTEDQVGTIGSASQRVDLFAEDIDGLESINDDRLVTVLDGVNETGDYQVQKDGSDTTGVINFKTS